MSIRQRKIIEKHLETGMKKMILGERKEQIEGLFSSAITISSNPIPRRSPTGHPTEHKNELDDGVPTYVLVHEKGEL